MSAAPLELVELLRARVVDVPDFPTPGVVFKDICPLLADHVAFSRAVDALAGVAQHGRPVDKVLGIEARGFIVGAPVAYRLGAGFVPVRKPGKLPLPTHETSYDLEYGSNALQLHRDAVQRGERVLVVDDVLATGGTAAATAHLVGMCGGQVVGVAVLIELAFLEGRARLAESVPGAPVHALLTY